MKTRPELIAKNFHKFPISYVTVPPTTDGFYELITDRYWAVTDDDCILIHIRGSKQCNKSKDLVERLVKMENHPATKVVLLPMVWFEHDCEDY